MEEVGAIARYPISSHDGHQMFATDGTPLFTTTMGGLVSLQPYCLDTEGRLVFGSWQFLPNPRDSFIPETLPLSTCQSTIYLTDGSTIDSTGTDENGTSSLVHSDLNFMSVSPPPDGDDSGVNSASDSGNNSEQDFGTASSSPPLSTFMDPIEDTQFLPLPTNDSNVMLPTPSRLGFPVYNLPFFPTPYLAFFPVISNTQNAPVAIDHYQREWEPTGIQEFVNHGLPVMPLADTTVPAPPPVVNLPNYAANGNRKSQRQNRQRNKQPGKASVVSTNGSGGASTPQHQPYTSEQADTPPMETKDALDLNEYHKTTVLTKRGDKIPLKRKPTLRAGEKFCEFCFSNKEMTGVYMSHWCHEDRSKRKVTCPMLRKHTCNLCGETGDNAHTIRYCPQNTSSIYSLATKNSVYREIKFGRNAAGDKLLMRV